MVKAVIMHGWLNRSSLSIHHHTVIVNDFVIVQELCESPGGRLELSVLTSLLVSVDVKLY